MLALVNYRLKVTLNDGRQLIGQMLAYDKHMNFVLAECEEFRRVKGKKSKTTTDPTPEIEQKRTLGLVILRGETIVSVSIEGPPPQKGEEGGAPGLMGGPGKGVGAGRGMPLMAGMAGPGQMSARPMAYARPPPAFPPGMMPPGFPGMPAGFPPGMPGMPPGFRPQGMPPGFPGSMPPGFPPGMGRPPQ